MVISLWRSPMALVAMMGCVLLMLAGCGARDVWASDTEVMAARYANGGAPELTLVTIMNYQTGRGDHTALFINGQERVVFDPAGSWRLDQNPRRHDVHFGMSPEAGASFYLSHVRPSHYAVVQRLRVQPVQADAALALALETGGVGPARCALSTSRLLRRIGGFEEIGATWWPHLLKQDFDAIPGVERFELHHDHPEIEMLARAVQAPLPQARPAVTLATVSGAAAPR